MPCKYCNSCGCEEECVDFCIQCGAEVSPEKEFCSESCEKQFEEDNA